jgi:hypothetical protein
MPRRLRVVTTTEVADRLLLIVPIVLVVLAFGGFRYSRR